VRDPVQFVEDGMKNLARPAGFGLLVAVLVLFLSSQAAYARWYQWDLRVVEPIQVCHDGVFLGLGTFSDEDRSTAVTARLLTDSDNEYLFTFSVAELPEQEPVYLDEYVDYLRYYDYYTLLWRDSTGFRQLQPGSVVSLNYDPVEISPDTQVIVEDCLILVEVQYIPILANEN
jgi:hypothetical protein